MKIISILRISILTILCFFSCLLAEENIVGTWKDPVFNILVTFYPNREYTIVSPYQGTGEYSIEGKVLYMKDKISHQIVYYHIVEQKEKLWVLLDIQGNRIALQKETAQKQDRILLQHENYQFKESDFQAALFFAEFLIERSLSKEEKKALKNSWLKEFQVNPMAFSKDLQDIQNAMQTLLHLGDPLKIGLVRQEILSLLYQNTKSIKPEQQPALIRLLFREVSVILFDEKTRLILTEKDIHSLASYIQFLQEMAGKNIRIDRQEISLLKEQIKTEFSSMPLEQKQIICCISLIWSVVDKNLKSMSESQKRQFYHQILSQNQQPVKNQPDAKDIAQLQEKWQNQKLLHETLSQISLNSHVSMMNVIENIGGTGNYWTIKQENQ